jgi:Acetyltransferase (GNAT) domain
MTPELCLPDPPLTDGVIALGPWSERDLEAVVEAVADPAIARWNHLPTPFDRRAARRWLEAMTRERRRGEALRLLIADARTRSTAGAISLQRLDWSARSAELGYWLTCLAVRPQRDSSSRLSVARSARTAAASRSSSESLIPRRRNVNTTSQRELPSAITRIGL